MVTLWTVVYTREAIRQIEGLHGKHRRRIESVLAQMGAGRRRGKRLRGELRGVLSERVGNHRILYSEERRRLIILVLAVVHRRLAYGGH